jgi:regulator of protease activity HflC (stomatin/prohibitin superfamily)
VVYLAVQIALREALVDVDSDAMVRHARRALGTTITDVARAAGDEVGIAVREVVVKDVILPPELRAAYAELVTTRARGAAQLEAARAETAALRSMANGAKLLDEHPTPPHIWVRGCRGRPARARSPRRAP